MKKVIKIALILLSLSFIATGCSKESKSIVKKDNDTNSAVIENQTINNINFKDFLVVYKNNVSKVYFDMENTNETEVSYTKVKCNLYDKSNNIIVSFEENIGLIQAKETKTISTNFDIDLSKVKKVEYILQ